MPLGSCQQINSKLQFKDIETLKRYLANNQGNKAAKSQIIKLAAQANQKRGGSRNGRRGTTKSFNH
jgi:hypothetical protein